MKCQLCHRRAITIAGDCSFCKKSHCSIHRLPEEHQCTEMTTCKQKALSSFQHEFTKNIIKVDKVTKI